VRASGEAGGEDSGARSGRGCSLGGESGATEERFSEARGTESAEVIVTPVAATGTEITSVMEVMETEEARRVFWPLEGAEGQEAGGVVGERTVTVLEIWVPASERNGSGREGTSGTTTGINTGEDDTRMAGVVAVTVVVIGIAKGMLVSPTLK